MMLKPKLLREFIAKSDPFFQQNAEALEVYVTEGQVIATGTASNSFLYRYKLNVLAMDYPNPLDNLTLPVMKWVREQQPDLIFNPDKREAGIRFDADILDNDTADILIVLQVTERVTVDSSSGKDVITHLPEPKFQPK
uniref:phage tail protein n=1 Tax=Providencia sp. PROV265 TaxID=2949953 RepID=UPI00234A89BD|nr:phage tail protein [Providencia sp. PROV265]